jgi:hypothetical protein
MQGFMNVDEMFSYREGNGSALTMYATLIEQALIR